MFYLKRIKKLEEDSKRKSIIIEDMAGVVFKLAVEIRQLKKAIDEKEKYQAKKTK
jgi:hypothetical protein